MTVFEPLRLPPVSGHVHRVARRRGAVWYVKYRMPDPTRPGRVRQVRKMLGPEWPEKGPPPPGYYDRRSAQEALEAVLTDARRGAIELSRTGVTFEQAAIEKRTRLGDRRLSEATRDPLASPVDTERFDTVGAPSRTGRAPTSIRTSSDHARKNGRGSRVFLAARARRPAGALSSFHTDGGTDMGRSLLAAAVCGTLAFGLGAQSAMAATVSETTGGRILYTASPGEANVLTISGPSGGAFSVSDAGTGVTVTAGTGCTSVSPTSASCSAAGKGITRMTIDGGDGNDTLSDATAISASIFAGAGNDIVHGGSGPDLINGGAGVDQLFGGLGDDELQSRGDVADLVDCGGAPGGPAAHDVVEADPFDHLANCGVQPAPRPTPAGQAPAPAPGTPFIAPSPAGTPAPVSFRSQGAPNPKPGQCPTVFVGTAANDRIDGTGAGDRMFGLAGDDVLNSIAGGDCLLGGDGNDQLFGADGSDLEAGGVGNDLVDGGSSADQLYGNDGRDHLIGRDGNDRLSGGAGNDILSGGLGNDRIFGGDGNDRPLGGAGADHLSGGRGNDRLDGGAGNDVIVDRGGRNTVFAGPGNDRIEVRNRSRDTVHCGSGRDTVKADPQDRLIGCERVTRASARR